MTGAHLHLILNHVPVIGIYFAILILILGIWRRQDFLIRLALGLFIGLAILTLAAYLTGEPAEDTVERMPGTSEAAIHEHEEAAVIALGVGMVVGILAMTILVLGIFKSRLVGPLVLIIMLLSLAQAALMARTAYLGGKVRRPELRGETARPSVSDYFNESEDTIP